MMPPLRFEIRGRLMRVFLACFLAVLTGLSVHGAAQVIRPGEVWLDDRGKPIQAHGGGILKKDDTYFWFGEEREQGLDPVKKYVGCYSSKDLDRKSTRLNSSHRTISYAV